jgi:hypothetical protein
VSTDQDMTEEVPAVEATEEVGEVESPDPDPDPDPEVESEIVAKTAEATYQLDQQDDDDDDDVQPEDMTEEVVSTAAKVAREERMRLMPEYLNHFFLEDLPPIDPEDPFNQGIYMRYRINQMRSAQGKEPAA